MKRIILVIGVISILLLTSIPSFTADETIQNRTIYVDDDGGADYTSIQDAIDNATNHDTIFVYTGMYSKNVIVDKPLTIIGENKENTIINVSEEEGRFSIQSDDVTLSGFTFSYNCMLLLGYLSRLNESFSNCRIENNIISGCIITVFNHSENNVISNNLITHTNPKLGPGFYVVDLGNNKNIMITKNTISNNDVGMVLLADKLTNAIQIEKNNYINNSNHAVFGISYFKALFQLAKTSIITSCWHHNYWDNGDGTGPHIIHGMIFFSQLKNLDVIIIPWIIIDWYPAKEPYDITVPFI